MEPLGLMDQFMYKADQYRVTSLVMGGASILEPARKGSALRARGIAEHIAARLERVPLLHQRFVQDPLRLGSVCKVEDPEFDVREHIHVEVLPEPGGYWELVATIGRLSSEPLDIDHLWRWVLLEGLEGGRVGVFSQMHHALFDGLGAMQVLSSMQDSKPVKLEKPTGKVQSPPALPTASALLSAAVAETSRRVLYTTPRFVMGNAGPVLAAVAKGLKDIISGDSEIRDALTLPEMHSTSLNTRRSSNTRSLAYRTLSLPEIKQLARHFSCTVNDVALLLYSFAMEHYFEVTGETIDFDLQCGMPISTRTEGSNAGNQVMAARINLHNTLDDAAERLEAIHVDSREAKSLMRPDVTAVDPGEVASLIPPALVDGLMLLAARLDLMGLLGSRLPAANALLSNVPGPREKTYIGNGLLAESIPLIPKIEVMAVSGGITSVGDTLTIGFHCDGEVVPDPDLFVQGLDEGLRELRSAAGVGRKKSRRKKS